MSLFTKLFGTHSEKEIKRLRPTLQKILDLRPAMMALSDEALRAKTDEFKKRYQDGETLDELLPEAYAVMREATRRCINQEHFEVQLIGGIVLHQGRIAEMKTGEGKTQTALLPAYLNALSGKGVHVVTVNDYLASRDADWMGQMHRFLGLTVGCVLNGSTAEERQRAYACDVTYVTNNELGFDYLRDNMVIYKKQLVLRDLNFAIIDEVDSILIDEARTPLIISGQSGKSTQLYEVCDNLAKRLIRGENLVERSKMDIIMGEEEKESGDFQVNEKEKTVNLTAQGIEKVEKYFQIDNYADPDNLELQHNMQLALRANYLMFRDQDYVVKDNEVLIVDEFTGRIMPGRRYSDGLHQAIEAKEHVKVNRESKTLATITFQNFFNKYDKKCGMTGTALTEETEFRNIYGMDVVEIPTNVPVIRQDLDDAVYKTKAEKYRAVVNEVKRAHATGQPILVGTITIEVSELLSQMLRKEGIKHNVLNAKFHEMEAEIVSQAGRKGAVTIATNMAGRGTDIKLGGTNTFVQDGEELTNNRTDEEVLKEREEVRALGGLKIIGTERHEARRIDNQLRGRSGRQGDPGETRFYISLEDDLMRLFGGERMMSMFNTLGVPDGEQIEHKMLSSAIERAQKRIESNNYSVRENLLKYDEVINEQREIIYKERRQVLDGESMRDVVMKMVTDVAEQEVNRSINEDMSPDEWDLQELNHNLVQNIPMEPVLLTEDEFRGMNKNKLSHLIKERAIKLYEKKEAEFPEIEQMRELERVVLLRVIDRHWMDHIDDMDQLRQGIGLMAYGNRDPLTEYRMAGFDMFNDMMAGIREDTVRSIYNARVEQPEERKMVAKITGTNKDETVTKKPTRRASAKIYPNDPCPCGSGKKYKNCHGRPGAPALP
ncbi:MAG: preprotein translocase subunit SecA [Lachnospiraceae bacterium]|nr:preprotein translocase subunit SecA [Lachnospiraceae bacterium]